MGNSSSVPKIDLTRPDLEDDGGDTSPSWDRTRVHSFMKGKGAGALVQADEAMAQKLLREFHLDVEDTGVHLAFSHGMHSPGSDTVIDDILNYNIPAEPRLDQDLLFEKSRGGTEKLVYDLGEWEDRLVGNALMSLQLYMGEILNSKLKPEKAIGVMGKFLKGGAVFALEPGRDLKGNVFVKNYHFKIAKVPDIEVKSFSWLDFCSKLEQLLSVYIDRHLFHAEIGRAVSSGLDQQG
jgi:hypothetical protein